MQFIFIQKVKIAVTVLNLYISDGIAVVKLGLVVIQIFGIWDFQPRNKRMENKILIWFPPRLSISGFAMQ